MKKIMFFICVTLLFIPILKGSNLTYANDGIESAILDTDDVIFLLKDKFDLNRVYGNNELINISGDFELIKNRAYTVKEMKNGTYDSERANGNVYSFRGMGKDTPGLVYKNSLETGEHSIEGYIEMTFKEAVIDKDGTKYDLNMIIDNVSIKTGIDTTKPILILSNSIDFDEIWYKAYLSLQEKSSENYQSIFNDSKYSDDDYVSMDFSNSSKIGVSYDTKFYVTKSNSTELVNKKMILSFRDIDQPDRFNGLYVDNENVASPYAEAILLKEGVNGIVHLANISSLNVLNTTFGQNTKYVGSATISNETSTKAAFSTKVDSSNFKINWSGSYCGTGIGLLNILKIEAKVIGEYSDEVSYLTPDDNTVINGTNKTIEVKPNYEYFVKKAYVDGEEISVNDLSYNENTNTYTFVFENVVDDHVIEFEIEKGPKRYLIHYNGNGVEGTMPDTIGIYNQTGTLSQNSFVNDGYYFYGWKPYIKNENDELIPLLINGEEVIFGDENEFLNLYGDNFEEVILYAQWVSTAKTGVFNIFLVFVISTLVLMSFVFLIKRKTLLISSDIK